MKIKILIVEDEVLVAEDLAGDLEDTGFEVTAIAISSEEAIESVQNNPPHIILMDINIKGDKDGIETAEIINNHHSIPIIYVSSNTSSQFVSRAISTGPHAFISKPFNKKDLVIAIELAFNKHNENIIQNNSAQDSIFVKKGDFHRKVMLEDVQYIQADGSYCIVFTKEDKFTFSFNLNHFQQQVSSEHLLRVHRSYIVNINNVDGFDKSSLLIGKEIIPVSSAYKDAVFEQFKKL